MNAQGKPPAALKFYDTNDSMLLGERTNDEAPVQYNAQTGRFVFITTVFAAFSSGKGEPEEEGPYQTGSSQVRIEAEGCQPLVVQFYDEMPDVEIRLSASTKP